MCMYILYAYNMNDCAHFEVQHAISVQTETFFSSKGSMICTTQNQAHGISIQLVPPQQHTSGSCKDLQGKIKVRS